MDDETQRWLADGIAQAKAGQHAQARDLLLRVVERDERNVQAWLWLAGVVSDPQDKRIALENVLALEPDNTAAKAGLEWLNRQAPAHIADVSTAELTSAPQEHLYTSPPASTEQLTPDEPVLAPEGCPRCGRAVQESDQRCPHCAQPLTIYAPKLSESARVTLLTTIWVVQALVNLADGLLMIMALQTMGGKSIVMGNINAILAGAAFRSSLPTVGLLQAMRLLITIDAVALAWSLVVVAILPARRPTAPIVALLVTAFHLMLAGGSLALGMSSPVVAAVRAILALFIGFWLLESQGDFEWQTARQRLGLDSSAKSSLDHYTQGRYYRRIEQTAKAVLHLERAVELNSERCEYRVALANAYYALGRLDRAAEQLRAALQLDPHAPDVREFLQVVTARQSEGESRVV